LFNKPYENKISYIDQLINNENEKVYIFQDSGKKFYSEIFFLKWAEYRYANNYNIIPENWTKKHINYYNTEFLNTRNLNCEKINTKNIENQYIYSYKNCISNKIKNNFYNCIYTDSQYF
jgi:hypothetical protein